MLFLGANGPLFCLLNCGAAIERENRAAIRTRKISDVTNFILERFFVNFLLNDFVRDCASQCPLECVYIGHVKGTFVICLKIRFLDWAEGVKLAVL